MECGGEMKVGDATEQRLQSAAYVGSEAARKGEDECFRCKRRGHWAIQCPFNISNHNKLTAPSSSSSYPVVRCPCGKGTCPIFTSTTTKNPSRKYYSCPVPLSSSLGGRCNFFKWCDELVDFKPPMCPCGAGFSSLNQLTSGPLANRWYFSCRIRKNHGACSFFQWADSELNSIMNRYMRQSKGSSSSQHSWTSHQALSTINHDFGKKEGFKLEELESPVVQNPLVDFALPTTDSPENMQNLSIVNSKQDKFLNDIAMQEAGSWNLSLGKALQVFQLMSQSDIQHRQIEFQRHISAARGALTEGVIYQMLAFSAYGWLGRLVFPPPRCLKDPAHATFFCCVFPSFDPVPDILEEVDVPDIGGSTVLTDCPSNIETDVPPPETPRQDAQLSCGILSRLKNPSSVIPVGDAVTGSIFKTFGEGLINILETMSSCDCERMLKVAEATFDTLHCLSIDCQPFYECVKEYIDFASRAVQIEEYMRKDVSSQQLIEEYDHKKARFEEISRFHTMKMAEYKASDHRFQALCQEVTRVKDMLLQLEQEMSLYEKKTLELETHVLEISEDMSESERSMEAAYMEMEEVLTLELERESMLHAAKTSLEAARIQLQ